MGEREKPDRIGVPDPESEPRPPKVEDAGALGEVGLRKRDAGEDREDKKGIWGTRPPTPNEDPAEKAAGDKPPLPD
jgi:hypothetical protein